MERGAKLPATRRDSVCDEPRIGDDPGFSCRPLAFLFGVCWGLLGTAMDWIYDGTADGTNSWEMDLASLAALTCGGKLSCSVTRSQSPLCFEQISSVQ